MSIEDRARELVEEKIADRPDLFIVRVKMHSNGVLEILMDGDQGIAIDDCVRISRHVGYCLEEEEVVDHAYRLEVSSPGIDTPLLLHRQYQKNIGRNVRVKLQGDGGKNEGKLIAVNEDDVVLEVVKKEKGKKAEIQEMQIPLDSITETKVLISFK